MDEANAPATSTTEAGSGVSGWHQTLTDLYVRHFEQMVGELTQRFGDRAIAEDAVQDAFLAFHTKAIVTARGREVAYLATAARNNVLMWLRREGRRHEIVTANAPAALRSPSAEDEALLACEAEWLSSDIADLPHRQATVIALRHLAGLSVAETADELGISLGTVKTHAYRGVRNLRTAVVHVHVAA